MFLAILLAAFLVSKGQSIEPPKQETCDGFECGLPGDVCVLMRDMPPYCHNPPCPLKPHCTERNNTCDGKRCPPGMFCEVHLKEGPNKWAMVTPMCMRTVRVRCGPNEYYDPYCDQRISSNFAFCEPSCDNRVGICDKPRCPPRKCICKEGYFRHKGKCIPGEQCPVKVCSESNTTWHNCPYDYTKNCRNRKEFTGKKLCLYPKCECKPGFVRDDFNTCIPELSCPVKLLCPLSGQIMQECPCEKFCYDQDKKCDSCAPRGCACAPGYALHYYGTFCVESDQCISPEPPMEVFRFIRQSK